MDFICLRAAADSVYRLAKRIAGRMTFDKDPDKIETAASKKEKEKQMKALMRNFAKVSHSNPVIVAEYLVSYVSAPSLLSACLQFCTLLPPICLPAHMQSSGIDT